MPKRKRTGFFKMMVIGIFSFSIVALIIGFAGAVFIYNKFSDELPDVRELKNFQPSTVTLMYSDQDELLAEFYLEKKNHGAAERKFLSKLKTGRAGCGGFKTSIIISESTQRLFFGPFSLICRQVMWSREVAPSPSNYPKLFSFPAHELWNAK